MKRKLSKYRVKKMVWYFCIDLDASKTALIVGVNRNTINRYFTIFRRLIEAHQRQELTKFMGLVELDESYFGPSRLRGNPGPRKRGRGTLKQPVFGIFERNGRVYTEIVPDCSRPTLRKVILGRVDPQSIVHTDGWRGYDGLVDVGYDRHVRVNHRRSLVQRGVHINGIESFWSFTKRRLMKFNGVKEHFARHLKECEWRWNKEPKQLHWELLEMLQKL